jgi:excisionase family DNA binding protein
VSRLQLVDRDQALHLSLNARQAAEALGVSLSHFQRHIQPHLRCIYSGRARLFRVSELDRWLLANEAPTVQDRRQAA